MTGAQGCLRFLWLPNGASTDPSIFSMVKGDQSWSRFQRGFVFRGATVVFSRILCLGFENSVLLSGSPPPLPVSALFRAFQEQLLSALNEKSNPKSQKCANSEIQRFLLTTHSHHPRIRGGGVRQCCPDPLLSSYHPNPPRHPSIPPQAGGCPG